VIGVTGATGQVGRRVAARLDGRGVPQRLIVRDPARAPQYDHADVRGASGYGSHDDMRAAIQGIDVLLLIPGEEALDRIEQHKTAVDAAVAAGVSHIVYLSFVGAAPDATFTLVRHHWATEQHIRSKGVDFTFLRMNMYMDFLPFMAAADGAIRGPADDGRAGFVTRDDLADVAAAVLVDAPSHAGAIYDVTGAESITLAEAADTMARVSGKPIRFVDETLEQAWESRRPSGAPDWEIEGWISSYVAIASGDLDVVADTVERIAGHEPVRLERYIRANPAALDHVRV
jgi:uncharacterized protein YbjT (DUF2867 family)